MIDVRGVTVTKHGSQLIRDITLSVARGSVTVLLGPNGSGKTTLLRAIAGTVPFHGDVTIDGVDIRGGKPAQLARIRAYAEQEPVFPGTSTLEDFVLMARTAHAPRFAGARAADRLIAREALEQCRIAHLGHRTLGSLSGGERRRAAIAQTIAQQTPVILLDEPTTALDVGQQQSILELVDSIRRDQVTTFVIALHDLSLARQYADHVAFLKGGQLMDFGPVETVLDVEQLETHYETSLVAFSEGNTHAIVSKRGHDRRAV
jgi:iron complex transport system ATP-binding protein